MHATDTVLVVGAGPTGLLLAGDLAAAGVACTVLERRVDESNLTRAFAVHARTLEVLDARGLADDLVATGTTVGVLRAFGRVQLDLSRLPTRFPFVLVTPQYHTERLLTERAAAFGADIVHGAEVVGCARTPTASRSTCAPRTAPPGRGARPTPSAPTGCAARCATPSACPSPAAPWSAR
jgi:2-polyprenyl-6-methoxyphenol hydroxylase-like FAD-dependent oxidoreductase